MKNVIFIGGVHGVGKGTLCKEICAELNFIHLIASEVLRWEDISKSNNKLVDDFTLTQFRLIKNLRNIINKKDKYILDGHYCLLNSKKEPERIEFETFQLLDPLAFVIVVDDVAEILTRLEARDKKKYEYELLAQFQKMELEYSIEVSNRLKKPHLTLRKNENQIIKTFLYNADFIRH